MNITQIKETCLYTTDLKRAEKFYSKIIGLELIDKTEGEYVFFRAGTSVLLIFNPEYTAHQTYLPPHDGKGKVHLAFEVPADEYLLSREELVAKGVKITHDHTWKAGRSFYFDDPDGHVLEIIEGDSIWR